MTNRTTVPVTIIIPCYNTEKFVGEAIQSALDQSLPVSEIIIVDDGSTDNSLSIVRQYAESHPELIRVIQQPNAGVAFARTAAMRTAHTEYALPLDADDRLHPQAVEVAYAYAQAHPECDVVFGDYYHMTDSGEPGELVSIGKRRYDPLEGSILPTVLWENVASAISLVRRDKVLAVGGYTVPELGRQVDSYEDVFLYMRMLVAGHQMGYVPHPFFYYRYHPNNVSKDTTRLTIATRQVLSYMFQNAPQQMTEAFYIMRRWRAEQIDLLNAKTTAQDAQLVSLLAQIERARVFQQEQTAQITALHAEIERARAFQVHQAAQITEYQREIETARNFQQEIQTGFAAQQAAIAQQLEELATLRHELALARAQQVQVQARLAPDTGTDSKNQ